jgi:hypothetical protein
MPPRQRETTWHLSSKIYLRLRKQKHGILRRLSRSDLNEGITISHCWVTDYRLQFITSTNGITV